MHGWVRGLSPVENKVVQYCVLWRKQKQDYIKRAGNLNLCSPYYGDGMYKEPKPRTKPKQIWSQKTLIKQ